VEVLIGFVLYFNREVNADPTGRAGIEF